MLVATPLALSAPAASEVVVEPRPRWSVVVDSSVLGRVDDNTSFAAGFTVDADYWIGANLKVGAFTQWVPFTQQSHDSCGYYNKDCLYGFVSTGPMLSAHTMPARWLDLFARGGLGLAFVGTHLGRTQVLDHWIVTLEPRAGVGIDFHVDRFVVGTAFDVGSFLHRNGKIASLGLRVGGAW